MTQTANNYARALWELGAKESAVSEAEEILNAEPALLEALKSPAVSLPEKERVIERIFPGELKAFIKTVCRRGRAALLHEIFEGFFEWKRREQGVLCAEITCVTPPTKEQLSGLSDFLKKRFGKNRVEFEIRRDPSLLGGFILRAGAFEYDRSLAGKYRRLSGYLYGGERS